MITATAEPNAYSFYSDVCSCLFCFHRSSLSWFLLGKCFCRSFMSKNKRPIMHHMPQTFSFLVVHWSSFLDFTMLSDIQTCETRARETYTLYWKLSRGPRQQPASEPPVWSLCFINKETGLEEWVTSLRAWSWLLTELKQQAGSPALPTASVPVRHSVLQSLGRQRFQRHFNSSACDFNLQYYILNYCTMKHYLMLNMCIFSVG